MAFEVDPGAQVRVAAEQGAEMAEPAARRVLLRRIPPSSAQGRHTRAARAYAEPEPGQEVRLPPVKIVVSTTRHGGVAC